MHLDVYTMGWSADVERLVDLGATVKEWFERHIWMLDPEGNDFCVVNAVNQ